MSTHQQVSMMMNSQRPWGLKNAKVQDQRPTETDLDRDRLRHQHRSRPPATLTPTLTETETDCDYDRNRPRPRLIATSIDDQGRLHTFTWFPAHYQALMKSSSLLSAHNSLWYAIGLRQRQEWKLEEFTGVAWHWGVGSWRRKRFWGGVVACTFVNNLSAYVDRPLCTVPMILL